VSETSRDQLADLTHQELRRYARHLSIPNIGPAGQSRLKAARVLLVGVGGLGSPTSLYLAAAGIGTLGLVDCDVVDDTNLQRQIIYGTGAVGASKLESAEARLKDLNPNVAIEKFETRLSSENALEIFRDFDLVVDGSDNFPTRYLVNDACVLSHKPNVYGSVFRFEGQASVFALSRGPCYRCLFQEPPPPGLVPSCAEAGILGVVPGIIGSIQALEVIKLVVGCGDPLVGRLLLFDALVPSFRELRLRKDPDCPVCSDRPTVRELIDYELFCSAGEEPDRQQLEITAADLSARLAQAAPPLLVDVREPYEVQICSIAGSLHIPLGSLRDRIDEPDSSREIVTVCHLGVRSFLALEILKAAGFPSVRSLKGGVEAWANQVDPGMARY